MGDERLRELERRYQETGSVDDEAAWLVARIRAGELCSERVVLAATWGDPASRVVIESTRTAIDSAGSLEHELRVRAVVSTLRGIRFLNRASLIGHLERWIVSGLPTRGLIHDHAEAAWGRIGKRVLGIVPELEWVEFREIPMLQAQLENLPIDLSPDSRSTTHDLVSWLLGYGDPLVDDLSFGHEGAE